MSQSNQLAIIHFREFIHKLVPNESNQEQTRMLRFQTQIMLPQMMPDEQDDDYKPDPVLALVHFFCPVGRSHLYQPYTFVYVSGSFHFTAVSNQDPMIVVNAYAADR